MNKTFSALLRLGFVFCLTTLVAYAQDGAESKPSNVFELVIKAGGVIGWIIIALSFVGVGLIVEHILNVKREKLAPDEQVEDLNEMLDMQQTQEAFDYCEDNPGYLTNVVGHALRKLESGYESMEQAAHDIGEEEAIKLHAKISWLSLLGNISPMLGLLGTVSGMLTAFGKIEQVKNPDASQLAGGIKEALVTTMLGLTVAIPMMIGFFFFRNRVVKIILEITAISEDILDRFRPRASGPAGPTVPSVDQA